MNNTLHYKLKYATIENRIERINKGRVEKIRIDRAYKSVYLFDVNADAYLHYGKYTDKDSLVFILKLILGGE